MLKTVFPDHVQIQGFVHTPSPAINVGESGLGCRLTTAICSVLFEESHITGEGSLLTRSMAEFGQILPQLGVDCKLTNGCLPLSTSGQARGATIQINGSLSSQYLSGLLMALPLCTENSIIIVDHPTSKPYVDITIDVLKLFNVQINQVSDYEYHIPGNQNYHCEEMLTIEGDYSAAANWMVLGAINDKGIAISGLRHESLQGDKAMFLALALAGVKSEWTNQSLLIHPCTVRAFEFDANHCPDLFPPLVVLAAAGKGISTIKGAGRLLHKESKRGNVLKKEFNKLGLKIDLNGDLMTIFGTGRLTSGKINAHKDHRIAMAGAISATLAEQSIQIKGAEAVEKSYPEFWKDMGI